MASVSYQIQRDGLYLSGPAEVTQGTAVPTTGGAIEVRIDAAAGWTKNEVELALDRISYFLWDVLNGDTSGAIPL